MPRIRFRDASGGWWPMGASEAMPPTTLRRAVGTSAIKTGTLRSRWGSTALFALAAHSLYRFAGSRFQGVGQDFYRDGVILRSGLTGNRLRFMRMPASPGDEDSLFVAGGGDLFKVAPSGGASRWGIVAPASDFIVAAGAAGVLTGTYIYAVTFKNSATGSRSNENPNRQTVVLAAQQGSLSNIPVSPDPQVDTREIWRSSADLTVLFKLDEIHDNTTTVFLDNHPDADLQPEELPLDNLVPGGDYNDAIGPYQGRAFWTRISTPGDGGRVFYSPIGRPEAVEGFIEINNGDDACQRLVFWGGSLYCFTHAHIFQIIGNTAPFTYREVFGAPGTTEPFSVVATPYGILYDSVDGIRLFDATQSRLIGFEALGRLLDGESLENVPAFNPVIAEYAGREVWFSDEATTLVIDPKDGSWRIAVAGITALHFEADTQFMTGSFGQHVVHLEPPEITTDVGIPIDFEVETPGSITDAVVQGLVQFAFLDVDTKGQLMTPTLHLDDVEIPLPPFKTDSRPDKAIEYRIGRWGRVVSLRLAGTLTEPVEVFGMDLDVYAAGPA